MANSAEKTEQVRFNVGGSQFMLHRDTLSQGPASRLTWMYEESLRNGQPPVFTIDRPAENFSAIVAFYQTGELHMPTSACPGAFVRELGFWGLSGDYLTPCCRGRLQQFNAEQKAMKEFEAAVREDEPRDTPNMSSVQSFRQNVWNIVDSWELSFLGKVYFLVVILMVLLSVVSLALSTDSRFQRPMTDCERLAYVQAAEPYHVEAAYMFLGEPNCTNIDLAYEDWVNDSSRWTMVTDRYDHELSQSTGDENITSVYIPSYPVPKLYFRVVEAITLIFFTIDLALRVCCCPSLVGYCKSIINVLDAAALLGAYIYVIIIHVDAVEMYGHTGVDLLSHMQVLRVLRLLRMARPLYLYKVLRFSLTKILRDLSIAILLLFAGVCTFASFAFVFEFTGEYEAIDSILVGWWWAVVTMTTVGYGDVIPQTHLGRLVASFCAFSGVILFALTIPIVVCNLLPFYKYGGIPVRSSTVAAKETFIQSSSDPTEAQPEPGEGRVKGDGDPEV